MKLTQRITHAFIEIKVDEIETTIFKGSDEEINEMIHNLEDVLEDLYSMRRKRTKQITT
jgi:hypothetical protein